MAAQALYLKYRPRTFEEVVGQEPITRTLQNALRQDRYRHAYLFTGPRGTGKTTTARLLAKAVNCLAPVEARPCNACTLCAAINDGRLMDLIEIDAASNRGIDEIRDIREKVGFRPTQASHKVYVLDEAHMLTGDAFNALLKTLEEPPPHVIFVLVTTEPHKIPATIASRCQRFDFRRVPLQAIIDRLAYIAEQEGLQVEPAALELIARQSTGALRDAISLLDQLTSYGDEIRLDQAQMVLGTVAGQVASNLAGCLAAGDAAGGLALINEAIDNGMDPRQLGREAVEYLRGVLLIQEGAGPRVLNATQEQAAEMEALAARIPHERLLRAIRLFNEAAVNLRRGLESIPQLPLEMALVESLQETEPVASASFLISEPSAGYAPRPLAQPETAALEAPVLHSAPLASPDSDQQAPAEAPTEPAPVSPVPAGSVTLSEVTHAWRSVLLAMRQRNPTTQAALASGCKPVEVNGAEIIVTLPFPMLEEKLRDPQRTLEIEEVLSEVLQKPCRVRLVRAGEYVPRQQAEPEPTQSQPEPSQPESEKPPADAPAGDEVLEAITQFAAKRGGKVKRVGP